MPTGTTITHAASVRFEPATYLSPEDIAGFLTEVLGDGDHRALPLALRTAADVIGMAELARRTGLSRETLYRTLSDRGNPRLDTLGAILKAFGLRIAIRPGTKKSASKSQKAGAVKRKTIAPPAAATVVRKRA